MNLATVQPQDLPTFAVLIQGETYRVKEDLKALGGRYDGDLKGWWIPKEHAAEARNLVDNCVGQMDLFEEE